MMSTRIKTTFAFLGAAVLLLPAVAGATGDGKKFSRADFERCNQQAMLIAGVDAESPAALPGAAQPGTQQDVQQPSQPGAQQESGTSGSGTGMSGTGTTGSGTGMTGTGTTGTSVGAAGDEELDRIVQAYRDCLQQAQAN